LKIFMSGTERLVESPGERYLRSRGIDLEILPRPPSSLRFHPGLWNTESRRYWPALVAAVTNIEGHLVAVHRTFLEPDGGGKASVKNSKKTLGSYRGASIELWQGSSNRALKDALPGDTVVIGEGLEVSLTAVLAAPEYRVLCAVSAFQAQGRTVKIARPPSTYKDFNDVAQRAPR
jgi:hypothetical protein